MQSLSQDYEQNFQRELVLIRCHLEDQAEEGDEDGDDDDNNAIAAWNICQCVHKYDMWVEGLATLRLDEWISSDVFILVIMCVLAG